MSCLSLKMIFFSLEADRARTGGFGQLTFAIVFQIFHFLQRPPTTINAFQSAKILSRVFGTANSLIVRAEIERDKNDRFEYAHGVLQSQSSNLVLRTLNMASVAGAFFLSFVTTVAFASSCVPPLETDLHGKLLPSEREDILYRLKVMAEDPNNAIFSGSLQPGPLGVLENRPEYIWAQRKNIDQIRKGFLGSSTMLINDAYLFDGIVMLNDKTLEVNDVIVQFNVFCLADDISVCSKPLPISKEITFGGSFIEATQSIIKAGSVCVDYLENDFIQGVSIIDEVRKNKKIWE